MKIRVYRGSRGVGPLILNLGIRRKRVDNFRPGRFTPSKTALVPAEMEFVLAADPV